MLKSKTFPTQEQLIEWANSPDGTDYIISIIENRYAEWVIFYIDEK